MSRTRAVAVVMLLAANQCSEWVPAGVAQATGAAHVRVGRRITNEDLPDAGSVVGSELEFPSRRALVKLRREGAWFEVRRSNTDIVVPVVLSVFGAAVLGAGLYALIALYKPPSISASDLSALGNMFHLSNVPGAPR